METSFFIQYINLNICRVNDYDSYHYRCEFMGRNKKSRKLVVDPWPNETCAAILLTNLAEPRWVRVGCYNSWLPDIMCESQLNQSIQNTRLLLGKVICGHKCITKNSSCICFVWKGSRGPEAVKRQTQKSVLGLHQLTYLLGQFPPIYSQDMKHIISVDKLHIQYQAKWDEVKGPFQMALLVVMERPESFSNKTAHLETCQDNSYFSSLFICEKPNCLNTEHPTTNNLCQSLSFIKNSKSHGLENQKSKPRKCHTLLFMDISGLCYQVQNLSGRAKLTAETRHKSNSTISRSPVSMYLCQEQGKIWCSSNQAICFDIAQICVYLIDTNFKLIPCPSGEHLQACNEFQCDMMLKCPGFYCVPWSNVCDNRWDCPGGIDEGNICSDADKCKHMFRCEKSSRCIHLGNICDNNVDCPLKDDENACELRYSLCPAFCDCLLFAISCYNITISDLLVGSSFVYSVAHITHGNVQFKTSYSNQMKGVSVLSVVLGVVNDVCQNLAIGQSLLFLNLSGNNINTISAKCLVGGENLALLSLHTNEISFLPDDAFSHLPKLTFLDISDNKIAGILSFPATLRVLNITDNPIWVIDINTLAKASMKILLTQTFPLGCFTKPDVVCLSHRPWYRSCVPLLGSSLEMWVFFAFTLLIMALNAVCSVRVYIQPDTHRSFKCSIQFITLGNLLGSLSLILLFIQSLRYGDHFPMYEIFWQSSIGCVCVYGLFVLYNTASPTFVVGVSVGRLLVVLFPLKQKCKQLKFIGKKMGGIMLTSAVFALSCSLYLWRTSTQIPSKLCSPFFDPTMSVFVIKFTLFVLVALPFLMLISIIYIYSHMQFAINKSQQNTGKSSNSAIHENPVLKKSIIFIISNFVSWIPSCVAYLTCFFLSEYPILIIPWATVLATTTSTTLLPVVLAW